MQYSNLVLYITKKGGKLILYLISIILYSFKVILYAYNTILYNRYWKKNNIPQQIMFLPHSSWSIVFVFVVSSFLAIHTSTTRDRRGTGTSQTMSKGTSLHQSAVAAVIILQLAPNVPAFFKLTIELNVKVDDIKPCKKCGIIEIPTSYMTQVTYQYYYRYLLWIASKFEIKKNMINWHQSHAKLHWNAFVANKMRCLFGHRVTCGCRGWISTRTWHTTGCTAVFLFQAHHALPRKPVLPETWKTSGGSDFWEDFLG